MGVKTKDVHFVVYTITCDYCGARREIDTEFIFPKLKNRREAVHSINWQLGRGGKVRCCNCRYYPRIIKNMPTCKGRTIEENNKEINNNELV